jgi:hypothetical protein
MKKSSRKTKRKGTVAVKVIAPKKFATGGAVSFDFDDTLSTDLGLQMAKSNPSSNKYVISARSEVTPDMIARARQAGIPDSNIFATGSDEAKVAKIQELGIKKHLDNKKSVIDRLGFKGRLFENGGNKKGNPPYKSPVQIVPYYIFDQPNTPEEWVKSIDQIEKIIGNPSTWTQDDYNIYQNKLNEYKIWRETTPEGQAVVDSSKRPNEYVIPLPTQLSTYLTSEQNRILQENPELQFIPKSKFAFGMPGAYGVTDEVGYANGGYSGLFKYADGGTEGEPIENPPIYTWEGDPNSYYRKDEKGNWRYLNKDTQSEFASGLYTFDKVKSAKVRRKLDKEAVLNPDAEAVLNQWGQTLPTPEISDVKVKGKNLSWQERRDLAKKKGVIESPSMVSNFFANPEYMSSQQLEDIGYSKAPTVEGAKYLEMAKVQKKNEEINKINAATKGIGTTMGSPITGVQNIEATYTPTATIPLPYAYAGEDESGNAAPLMTRAEADAMDKASSDRQFFNYMRLNQPTIEKVIGRKLTDSDLYDEEGNYNYTGLASQYANQDFVNKVEEQKYQDFLAESQKAADEAGVAYNTMDFLRNLVVDFPYTVGNLAQGKMPLFQQALGLRSEDPNLKALYERYTPSDNNFLKALNETTAIFNPATNLQDAQLSYDLGNYSDAALYGLGSLPLLGALGKGVARGVGAIDDAYRLAMAKSDEFARSLNLADEAPVTDINFYHGGLPVNATLDDIDLLRLSSRQQKKGRDYAGFYMSPDINEGSWALKYNQQNPESGLHKISLPKESKVYEYSSSIERIKKSELEDLMNQGYDYISGKNIFGQPEYVLLNKDKAVLSLVDEAPSTIAAKSGATNLPVEGETIIHPFTGKPTPIETISSEIDYFQAGDGLPYEAARGSEQWKILSNDPRFKYVRTSNIPSVVIDSPLSLGEDLYDARKLAIPLSEIEQYRITGDTSGNPSTTTSGLTSTSNLSEPVFFKPKKGVEGIIDTVKYIFDEVKFGKKNIKYKLDNYSNIKNTPKLYKDEISKLFTPEGISRLKDLGVDDIDDFMNFMDKAVSSTSLRDKTEGGAKTVNKEKVPYINVNFKEIKDILKSGKLKEEDLRSVIAHEIGHNIQSYLDTINRTFSGKSTLDVEGIIELLPFVRGNVSDFLSKSVGMTEEQADDLAKSMTSMNKEIPNASYYFTGSFGREPLAHLRELKQTMQNRGVIKNIHDKVTMDDIHNFYTYYDGYNDRILSFLKPSNAAFSAIASLLNKTPGLVPYVIGAGAAGEGINQMSNDNEKMYGGIQKNKYIGLFR